MHVEFPMPGRFTSFWWTGAIAVASLLLACTDETALPLAPPHAARSVTVKSTTGFTMVELSTLGGQGWARAVNDSGLIVGMNQDETGYFGGAYWTPDGQIHSVSTITKGVVVHDLWAVNDAGVAVGDGYVPPFTFVAVMWSRSTGVRVLPTPSRWSNCIATGINRFGTIVGNCDCGPGVGPRGVMWPPGGGLPVNLGALPANPDRRQSEAHGIDVHTTVVGEALDSHDFYAKVFIKRLGQPVQRLEPHPHSGEHIDQVGGISPLMGYVAGAAFSDSADGGHAFLWEGSGYPRDLGALGPHAIVGAAAVNDHRWVVGESGNGVDLHDHAFLWRPDHGMQELGTQKEGMDGRPMGLNNHGRIVGYMQRYDRGDVEWQAVMWIVPEQ